tara:strand:+ start:173 stop:490 length:318 start_codon:yes stop_codon:yes gene_type:complete
MKKNSLRDLIRETILEVNGSQTLTKHNRTISDGNFDSRLKSFMDKTSGPGEFEKATEPDMPEATKVWDALVKTFSDNKNDSISYLNSNKSYRKTAITEIFRAINF